MRHTSPDRPSTLTVVTSLSRSTMSIQLGFSGELVVVTGGATGLGFATARAFGLCGATIALNDLTEDRVESACERLRQESIACRGYMADVRDAEAVSALVTTFEE